MDNTNQNQTLSDIPGLGDQAGLEKFLQDETLKAMGQNPINPTPAPAVNPAANPAAAPAPATTPNPNVPGVTPPATPAQPGAAPSAADVAKMQTEIETLKAQIEANKQAAASQQPAYSPQMQAFIQAAIAKGYSMDQIQRAIAARQNPAQTQLAQRVAAMEKAMQDQQNAELQNRFISKMTTFGDKWGLNENDLVFFAQKAYSQGINVANENVNLDLVFRACFPEQYAIRSQRMRATPTSQIYGGASTPNNPNAQANKMIDAYVESYLKSTMPAQYSQMLNKK